MYREPGEDRRNVRHVASVASVFLTWLYAKVLQLSTRFQTRVSYRDLEGCHQVFTGSNTVNAFRQSRSSSMPRRCRLAIMLIKPQISQQLHVAVSNKVRWCNRSPRATMIHCAALGFLKSPFR
jgi:hypothetical protein